MSLGHNNPPKVDPGEYAAPDRTLVGLFHRVDATVTAYSPDGAQPDSVRSEKAQQAKDLKAFVSDLAGSYADLRATGQEHQLFGLLMDADKLFNDHNENKSNAEEIEEDLNYLDLLINLPVPLTTELWVDSSDEGVAPLLIAAGYGAEVAAVNIVVEDYSSSSQTDVKKSVRAYVLTRTESGEHPIESLTFEQYDAALGDDVVSDDDFRFSKKLAKPEPTVLGQIRSFEDILDSAKTEIALGVDKITNNEAGRLHDLMELYAGYVQTQPTNPKQ